MAIKKYYDSDSNMGMLDGKTVVKEIYVKGKLVNLAVKG